MDTRFWGPSGWRLLHLIVATPLNIRDQDKITEFFKLVPYVLPCKFCRYSLACYYEVNPVPDNNKEHWLYNIHNDVNEKLRSQGLLKEPNPTYSEIHNRYKKWAEMPCASTSVLGWDFLTSIANTTPSKNLVSTKLPDAPENISSPEQRNKWNTMSYKERLPYIKKWWDLLPYVLPFEPWTKAWLKAQNKYGKIDLSKGKKPALAWVYNMEQTICTIMAENAQHSSFYGLCKEVNAFSSGCGKKTSSKVKTCRADKKRLRNSLRNPNKEPIS